MNCDLFTSDVNLSLIVGHKGPHSPEYTEYIDGLLRNLKQTFRNEFNIDYTSSLANNPAVSDFINSEIRSIIMDIKNKVSINKKLINKNDTLFILD